MDTGFKYPEDHTNRQRYVNGVIQKMRHLSKKVWFYHQTFMVRLSVSNRCAPLDFKVINVAINGRKSLVINFEGKNPNFDVKSFTVCSDT